VIYVLLALEIFVLALALRWGSTRDQRERAQSGRILARALLQAVSKRAPNGVTEGDHYQPAPPSGPQRTVE
jgi:hypothetical protein